MKEIQVLRAMAYLMLQCNMILYYLHLESQVGDQPRLLSRDL
jgi:hypothetical protein